MSGRTQNLEPRTLRGTLRGPGGPGCGRGEAGRGSDGRSTGVRGVVLAAALAAGLAPAALAAAQTAPRPPLGEVAFIWDWLFAAAVGDRIRNNCPTISPRLLRVLRQRDALVEHARGLGYSDDEIRAFIADPGEKARMRDLARAYLAAHGVTRGDAESYCRLGRAEIAAGSKIGQLIYEH
ncbi:MAG: hypothetical protein KJZ85_06985 [Rhodobacteraceae bacterium]|nr:hypothetical protein [Paracoccaceae bacterium]